MGKQNNKNNQSNSSNQSKTSSESYVNLHIKKRSGSENTKGVKTGGRPKK